MNNNQNGKNLIHFGTSSFSWKEWVGKFYPEGTKPSEFLRHYSRTFDTVEVDATYYSVPSPSMVEGWRSKIPEGFTISAKFPRSIVHAGEDYVPDARRIMDPDATYADRDRFLGAMARLGGNLGPLLLQFPYFPRDVFTYKEVFFELLNSFLEDLPQDYRYAVEIRNRYWYKADFAELCRKHKVALVLADQQWMPHGDEVEQAFDPVTADFSYIRLLGDRKEIEAITKTWDREVIDRTDRIKRWAEVLSRLAKREVETFVFANNHYAGFAPGTITKLQEMYRELDNGAKT